MTDITDSFRDKEDAKFRQVQTDKIAVGITADEALPVFLTNSSGAVTNVYNEISALAGGSTTTLVTYTVPAGKQLELSLASFGGENSAIFSIIHDSITLDKKRTWFTRFYDKASFNGLIIDESETIRIEVENFRSTSADFNGRIIGILK